MAKIVKESPPGAVRSEFLESAWKLGARLSSSALWDGDRCNWSGASMEFLGGSWTVAQRTFGPDLYSGTSGVALFLYHLHEKTGERIFKRTAEGALRQAWSRREMLSGGMHGSLYSGILGVAYARLEAGRLLGDHDLIESALAAVEGLLKFDADPKELDVISGSAGAVPVLLEIHRRHPRDFLIELALRHAENLLGSARKEGDGWSWRTLGSATRDNLTGYSHGAAGIAVALLEANRVAPDKRFATAAENGFLYERKWFDAKQNNWADLRIFDTTPAPVEQPPCSMAWCHGAPGIALARLRAYELVGDASWRSEAETALETTARSLEQMLASGSGGYSLCHGHAGNAEILLYAAELIDPTRRALAENVGRLGIARYERLERPWPCGVPNGGETPGLMLGWAGIGYFYLRLHDPKGVPSVLLIRPPAGAKAKRSQSAVLRDAHPESN
jgi:lantibiotic modifying enzyme